LKKGLPPKYAQEPSVPQQKPPKKAALGLEKGALFFEEKGKGDAKRKKNEKAQSYSRRCG